MEDEHVADRERRRRIVTLGGGANVADTAEPQPSTGCVKRLVISHVPGRLDKVWAIRCIPIRTTINRH